MNHVVHSAQRNLDAARRSVADLRSKLAKAEAEVFRFEGFLATYSELDSSPHYIHEESDAQRPDLPKVVAGRTGRRGKKMDETERHVATIIQQLARPAKTRELLEIMSKVGFQVGGLSPVSTLSARLSRSQNIVNDRTRGWMTKEMAGGIEGVQTLPPADHPSSGPVEPEAGGGG